jgi:hypothetical protein
MINTKRASARKNETRKRTFSAIRHSSGSRWRVNGYTFGAEESIVELLLLHRFKLRLELLLETRPGRVHQPCSFESPVGLINGRR